MSDKGYTTDVFLYPAAGAGIQLQNTPQGPIPLPIPFIPYKNVRDITTENGPWGTCIKFTKPSGEKIQSNLPYVIVQSPVPEGDA